MLHIDPAEVERAILGLAAFGAVGETGVSRPVYGEAWVGAMAEFTGWCREAGLAVSRDAAGSVWGRLQGSAGGPAIVSGSHIDSQCPGGRYDGALGVIAALFAVRALKQAYGTPRRTIEIVAFCEEEGSRFPSAGFWGSRAVVGKIAPGDADALIAYGGETMTEAMRAVDLEPDRLGEAKRDDIEMFVELHIEQGPILEDADTPVAIVDAVTGIRHMEVTLTGETNHAGAFPMDLRRDAMAGFAEIASGVVATAHRLGRPAVTTVGRVEVEPNAAAIIPGRVLFTVDARHPDPVMHQTLYAKHAALIREVAARRDLGVTITEQFNHPPCLSDPDLVKTFEAAAVEEGIATLTMPSGAGHDTQQMAQIARTAMIFVRSQDGRSHTPEEFSTLDDIVAAIRVLARGLHRLAY